METAYEALRFATNVLFLILGGLAVVHWLRQRSSQALWLAATFTAFAVVTTVARIMATLPPSPAVRFIEKVDIATLVVVPFFLYRFTAAFGQTTRLFDRVAAVVTAVVAGSTFLLPYIPDAGEPRPAWFQLYVLGLLVQWTGLMAVVAVTLWRGGRGQPTVARRRMRMLSLGASAIALALILAGLAPVDEGPTVLSVVVQAFALASVILFYLAFSLPGVLRVLWRRAEDAGFRETALGLMGVTSTEQTAAILLPYVSRMSGGGTVVLADRRELRVMTHGPDEAATQARVPAIADDVEPGTVVPERGGVLAVSLRWGVLAVHPSPFMPFFGQEEMDLMRRIALFADLALERAELMALEREARAEVEAANEELESFVYSVSHDLKSPLVSVLGYLDLLKMDLGDVLEERGSMYVNRISASAMYMNRLIMDLLELSKIGRVQTETEDVDLAAVAGEVAGELCPSHPSVRFDVAPLPVVRMNPVRARQLFTNLMANAVHHGGREDLTVRVGERHADGLTEVYVADDGQGIPDRYHEKVFGVFERLDTTSGYDDRGTGIGLAVCKKIVEQLGGTIAFSNPDEGAEVVISLPTKVVKTGADRT